MARTQPKTQPTPSDVQAHLQARASEAQRADCDTLLALLGRVTGAPATMWGPSIVGFGRYDYTYASGHGGSACLTGFAVRGRELVVYLTTEGPAQAERLARLGPHKMGKACLYLKRLADVDLDVLEALVADSVAATRARHPTPG